MKELSIEEKAKRYDDAIEIAQRFYNNSVAITKKGLEDMFPELAESEDERIRKEIIYHIQHCDDTIDEVAEKRMIAWLEKQCAKVSAIECFETEFDRQVSGLIASVINKEHEYNQGYVKWTANTLLNYAKHELENQGKQKSSYYSYESNMDFKIEANKWYVCIKDYYYSDIDELMFTKGKAYKAYIDWGFISNNGTKKTPIGLFPYKEYFRPATDEEIPHEQKPAECRQETKPNGWIVCEDFNDGDGYYKVNLAYLSKSQVELIENLVASWQNPTNNTAERSEDDEKFLSDIIKDLVHPWNEYIPDRIEDEIKWLKNKLKSIKGRVQPQTQQEWSKEDEDKIEEIKNALYKQYGEDKGEDLYYYFLEPILYRMQSQQKWSEEDEKFLSDIIKDLVHPWNEYIPDRIEDEIKWLKNRLKSIRPQNKTYYWTENEIKFAISDYIRGVESYEKMVEKLRCLKPQSHWKPNALQIEALESATENCAYSEYQDCLRELAKQLKKL